MRGGTLTKWTSGGKRNKKCRELEFNLFRWMVAPAMPVGR